jgi:hypothetical protein
VWVTDAERETRLRRQLFTEAVQCSRASNRRPGRRASDGAATAAKEALRRGRTMAMGRA